MRSAPWPFGAASARSYDTADIYRYAVVLDTIFGGQSANTAAMGTLTANSFSYTYTLLGSANVKASVTKNAGQTLNF